MSPPATTPPELAPPMPPEEGPVKMEIDPPLSQVYSQEFSGTPLNELANANNFTAWRLLENGNEAMSVEDCYIGLALNLRNHFELNAAGYQQAHLTRREAIYRQMKNLIPEMTKILTESTNEKLLLSVLDFCHVLYEDVTSVTRTLYLFPSRGIGKAYFSSFRVLLDLGRLSVKEQAARVILQILQTYQKCGKFEETTSPILDFMLSADLDECFIKCLDLNNNQIFNNVIQIFSVLVTIPHFPADRIISTIQRSLRVAHLTISENNFDRNVYFNFLWAAFKVLDPARLLQFEHRIMGLFESLLFNSQNEPEYMACHHFGEFAMLVGSYDIFNKLVEPGSLALVQKLLRVPSLRQTLASYLLQEDAFILSLDSGLNLSAGISRGVSAVTIQLMEIVNFADDEVEINSNERLNWDLSKMATFLTLSTLTVVTASLNPMLDFFISNLRHNLKNPLVQILESDGSCRMHKISNVLNQIEAFLQNLQLRTSLTVEQDEKIWETLLEIQAFVERQRENEGSSHCLEDSDRIQLDPIYIKSTQYFIRCYMAHVTVSEVSSAFLKYLERYIQAMGNENSLNARSLETRHLFDNNTKNSFLKAIAKWLMLSEDSEADDGFQNTNLDKRTELASYINKLFI